MRSAIGRLLAPYRTAEIVGYVGTSREAVRLWKYTGGLVDPGKHDGLARALVALRGGNPDTDPEAVTAAKAEVEAAYRADLGARTERRAAAAP